MVMARFLRGGRNKMNINVEDIGGEELQPGQPGLFPGLSPGHCQNIRITVGVAAWLEPPVQLAVMVEENIGPVRRDDPGRAGYMANGESTVEAIGISLNEMQGLLQVAVL